MIMFSFVCRTPGKSVLLSGQWERTGGLVSQMPLLLLAGVAVNFYSSVRDDLVSSLRCRIWRVKDICRVGDWLK